MSGSKYIKSGFHQGGLGRLAADQSRHTGHLVCKDKHRARCKCGWRTGKLGYCFEARDALLEHYRKAGCLLEVENSVAYKRSHRRK